MKCQRDLQSTWQEFGWNQLNTRHPFHGHERSMNGKWLGDDDDDNTFSHFNFRWIRSQNSICAPNHFRMKRGFIEIISWSSMMFVRLLAGNRRRATLLPTQPLHRGKCEKAQRIFTVSGFSYFPVIHDDRDSRPESFESLPKWSAQPLDCFGSLNFRLIESGWMSILIITVAVNLKEMGFEGWSACDINNDQFKWCRHPHCALRLKFITFKTQSSISNGPRLYLLYWTSPTNK